MQTRSFGTDIKSETLEEPASRSLKFDLIYVALLLNAIKSVARTRAGLILK